MDKIWDHEQSALGSDMQDFYACRLASRIFPLKKSFLWIKVLQPFFCIWGNL